MQRNQHFDIDLRGDVTDVIAADPVLDRAIFHSFGVIMNALLFAQEGTQDVSRVLDAVD